MSSTARETIAVQTVDDVVAAVKQAAADQVSLTASRERCPADRRLDLSPLNAVVDYPARDMTITVAAGRSVGALREQLATEHQQLPVDVADAAMSVGAFVASDLAGSRQYGYGTLRDYVIGVEVVDGQGRVFHAGGRVVKNVAGYDLCRLLTGSRGTLGVITQLTFKLKPLPEHAVLYGWSFAGADAAAQALETLNTSQTCPVILDLQVSAGGLWQLFVGVEGSPTVCAWQVDQLQQELAAATNQESVAGSPQDVTRWCQQQAERHLADETQLVVRARPSQVTTLCDLVVQYGGTVHSHAGNGVLLIAGADRIDELRTQLQAVTTANGGAVTEDPFATDFRSQSDSWSCQLATTLDPQQIFA